MPATMVCIGQRTVLWSQFSPSAFVWISRIRYRWSDLLSRTISLALHTWLFNRKEPRWWAWRSKLPFSRLFHCYGLLPDTSAKKANCQKPNLEIRPLCLCFSFFCWHNMECEKAAFWGLLSGSLFWTKTKNLLCRLLACAPTAMKISVLVMNSRIK